VQYDDIPVEVSGEGCPEPMVAFDPAVLGEALMRNLGLANYARPTPVQKYRCGG
jgi:ATP-dependent RNA helicase DDX3X